MSVDIWPPISPADLKTAVEDTKRRELQWLLDELHETLKNIKHGLEDCYALLAPIDPGSTLVVSTPRNEIVKGHVTRVGTRIVKGALSLKLRTIPAQTLVLDPAHPIHLAPLTHLHALLTDALDVLTQTLAHLPEPSSSSSASSKPQPPPSPNPGAAAFISAQLRLLSTSLAEAVVLLKGPPLTAADPGWTSLSAAPSHFLAPPAPPPSTNPLQTLQSSLAFTTTTTTTDHPRPPTPSPSAAMEAALQNLSVYFGIQDSCLVLWVRALEPADAPLSVGMKFALAIGTARRLEHDESERVFGYCCAGIDGKPTVHGAGRSHGPGSPTSLKRSLSSQQGGGTGAGDAGGRASPKGGGGGPVQVYVREKVRVESADPNLMALSAKLTALSHTLGLARRNLAAVMGEDMEE